MELEGGQDKMAKKAFTNAMHEIRPGLSRGHASRNMTPADKAKLAKADKDSVAMSDAMHKNFARNAKKTIF